MCPNTYIIYYILWFAVHYLKLCLVKLNLIIFSLTVLDSTKIIKKIEEEVIQKYNLTDKV